MGFLYFTLRGSCMKYKIRVGDENKIFMANLSMRKIIGKYEKFYYMWKHFVKVVRFLFIYLGFLLFYLYVMGGSTSGRWYDLR